eukprot:8144935-Pyramimonas_sp.AAC.1
MLHAVSPWTEERDAFIRTLDSKEARVLTRRREGGRPAGFHPWSLPLETVGGAYWYANLTWDEDGWIYFVRALLGMWDLPRVLQCCVLRDPNGPYRMEAEDLT